MRKPISKIAKITRYFDQHGTTEKAADIAKKLKVSVPLVYKARSQYAIPADNKMMLTKNMVQDLKSSGMWNDQQTRLAMIESVNNRQEGGSHYKTLAIQPWDYIIQNNLGFLEGNVIKYVTRWRTKEGVQDLQKARHFLDKLIEVNNG